MKTKIETNDLYLIDNSYWDNTKLYYSRKKSDNEKMIRLFLENDNGWGDIIYDIKFLEYEFTDSDDRLIYESKTKNRHNERGYDTNKITILKLTEFDGKVKKYEDVDQPIYTISDSDNNIPYFQYTYDKSKIEDMCKSYLIENIIDYDEINIEDDGESIEITVTNYLKTDDEINDEYDSYNSSFISDTDDYETTTYYSDKVHLFEAEYKKWDTKRKKKIFNL